MRVLFLAPYPLNEAPSQRFRFEHFLKFFAQYKHQYKFQSFWSKPAWNILYTKGHLLRKTYYLITGYLRRLFVLTRLWNFNIVFIHREAAPLGPPIFEFLISKIFRKAIIYDFDDAIWLHNTSEANKIVSLFKHHHKVNSICRWSWKISAGNAFLADYARKYNDYVVVVPTVVDAENYHCQLKEHKKKETITIGWTGTHSTSVYLDKIAPVIRELSTKYNIEFNVISNQPLDIKSSVLKFTRWKQAQEIEQLLQFDIGIMPLDDTDWEKGKCGFKAIQYMALGIPCVASPVGVNNSLINSKQNGFLADDMNQWREYLTQLIEDDSLRTEIGTSARATIVQRFSVLAAKESFFSLFA